MQTKRDRIALKSTNQKDKALLMGEKIDEQKNSKQDFLEGDQKVIQKNFITE